MSDINSILSDIMLEILNIDNIGENASYIPALAKQDRNILGISIMDVDGNMYNIGDHNIQVPIESISKVFTLALALNKLNIEGIEEKIGLNPSFLGFDSVLALKLAKNNHVNPFVNNGAMATTSLIRDIYKDKDWSKIHRFYNLMANDKLLSKDDSTNNSNNDNSNNDDNSFDEKLLYENDNKYAKTLPLNNEVFVSETMTNQHNLGLAYLLAGWNSFYADVPKTVETYTKQCSIMVSSDNLATMAASIANNGINPISKKRLIKKCNIKHILSLMLSNGLYQESGKWSVYVGVPGKSGVGGGILMVSPGKCGIGIVSPPLNEAGNSYMGWEIAKRLSKKLKLNVFETYT